MSWLNKKNLRKWLRIIHRDLGYFVVGITLVYAISGIILNHKQPRIDPAYKTIVVEVDWESGLTATEFENYFSDHFSDYTLNKIVPDHNRYQLFLKSGVGSYHLETGALKFEIYQKKPFVFFINKLHYNQKRYWTTPADFYAGALILLVLSGLIMVRGKKGLTGSGKWYVLAGIVLVVVYIWI